MQQQQPQEEEDWKEYRIHDEKAEQGDDEEEYGRYVAHNLFDSQEVDGEGESEYYEVYTYTIDKQDTGFTLSCKDEKGDLMPLPSTKTKDTEEVVEPASNQVRSITLSLRHHLETANSTGLGVWTGSELLAQYLLQPQFHQKIQSKHVVELGAGVGLCGLVAHLALEAARVTLTDGDSVVLRNLRYNIQQNMDGTSKTIIECKQLIWGEKQAQKFLKDYHNQQTRNVLPHENKLQVVMASDCLYMVQSVVPFWEAVAVLLSVAALTANEEDFSSSPDDRMVIYVHGPASQVPIEKVLETAQSFGFDCVSNQEQARLYVFLPKKRQTVER